MMKLILLMCVLLIVTESGPLAQSGTIELSSSYYRHWCCYLYDNAPGLVKAYAHHAWTPGARGSKFMIGYWQTNMVYLGESSPFETIIGDSRYGITIDYGECLEGPFIILEILFFAQGLTPPCTFLDVLPSPDAASGQIEVMDCAEPPNTLIASGGTLVINPGGDCYCCGCDCDPDPVPVEQTSWGRIKALYLGN